MGERKGWVRGAIGALCPERSAHLERPRRRTETLLLKPARLSSTSSQLSMQSYRPAPRPREEGEAAAAGEGATLSGAAVEAAAEEEEEACFTACQSRGKWASHTGCTRWHTCCSWAQ